MNWNDEKKYDGNTRQYTDEVSGSEIKLRHTRLSVHHYVGCGDTWFMSTHLGGFDRFQLTSEKLEDAKREALKRLRLWCLAVIEGVNAARGAGPQDYTTVCAACGHKLEK